MSVYIKRHVSSFGCNLVTLELDTRELITAYIVRPASTLSEASEVLGIPVEDIVLYRYDSDSDLYKYVRLGSISREHLMVGDVRTSMLVSMLEGLGLGGSDTNTFFYTYMRCGDFRYWYRRLSE